MVKFHSQHYRNIANDCISIVSDILNKHDIEWTIGYGTLLGCIRDGSYIPHDRDVDFEVYNASIDDIIKIKEEISKHIPFETLRKYKDTYYLLAFRIEGMRVDLHLWKDCGDCYCRFEGKNIPKKFYKIRKHDKIVKKIFNGIEINIPYPPDRYLSDIYGEDWMICKSKWYTIDDSPAVRNIEEYKW